MFKRLHNYLLRFKFYRHRFYGWWYRTKEGWTQDLRVDDKILEYEKVETTAMKGTK